MSDANQVNKVDELKIDQVVQVDVPLDVESSGVIDSNIAEDDQRAVMIEEAATEGVAEAVGQGVRNNGLAGLNKRNVEVAEEKPSGARIIAFMNQKGGVGKTTSTVNIGASLAKQGKRVLLIDLDPQAHLTLHLGIDPDKLDLTLYDLMRDDTLSAMDILLQVEENIGVLPAEVSLAGIESELGGKVAMGTAQRVLKDACACVLGVDGGERLFDYVLLDCPPSLGLLTINALTMAGEVIVPMQAHFLALQGLSKLLETIGGIRQGLNPSLSLAGVVVCMYEGQTILAQEVISDLSSFLDGGRGQDVAWRDAVIYDPAIRRNIKLAESPSFGQSIFDYAPSCKGAADYLAVGEAIIKQGRVSV